MQFFRFFPFPSLLIAREWIESVWYNKLFVPGILVAGGNISCVRNWRKVNGCIPSVRLYVIPIQLAFISNWNATHVSTYVGKCTEASHHSRIRKHTLYTRIFQIGESTVSFFTRHLWHFYLLLFLLNLFQIRQFGKVSSIF